MNVIITAEVIPGKTTAPTVALRFPYLPEVGAKIKALGFWWAPVPTLCWFIPERLSNNRAKALLLRGAINIFNAASLCLVDNENLIAAADTLLAGGTVASGIFTQSEGNARRLTAATQALAAELQAQINQSVTTHNTLAARGPIIANPAPVRDAQGRRVPQQNLNTVVNQRRDTQLAAERTRRAAIPRVVEPTPLNERTVYLLQSATQITYNGQTLSLAPEDFEKIQALLTCPMQNSFNQELLQLRTKRAAFLDAGSARSYTILVKQAGQLSDKNLVNAWQDTDLFPLACDGEAFDELNDEFETLSRALGASGSEALNHTGCRQCSPKRKAIQ